MAWIVSYFTERTHQVELEYYDNQYELKARSDPSHLIKAFRKAQSFDPQIFIIYINSFRASTPAGKKQLCLQMIQQLSLP